MSPSHEPSRLHAEQVFHDDWAKRATLSGIDVIRSNEACTAPEMRWLIANMGTIRGKKVLDVGCGLGEASVYFAIKGALVTATDLSPGMLEVTQRLAARHGVLVRAHQSNAESLRLPPDDTYDIIYVGNLLHHVNIDKTLAELARHLKPSGTLAAWDPIAYNPLINIYRRLATSVRTSDEHPLRKSDIAYFSKYFRSVQTRFFWLSTLSIFVLMATVLLRNPNRVRYWKKVVDEAELWKPLYLPLEAIDRVLMAALPPLRYLCWNIAVLAKAPK